MEGSFKFWLDGEVGEVFCGKPLKSEENGDSQPSLPRICPLGTAGRLSVLTLPATPVELRPGVPLVPLVPVPDEDELDCAARGDINAARAMAKEAKKFIFSWRERIVLKRRMGFRSRAETALESSFGSLFTSRAAKPRHVPPSMRPPKSSSFRRNRSPLLGAHMSIAGGVDKAMDRAVSIGAMAAQIFVKNNMQWFATGAFPEEEVRAFREHPGWEQVREVFGHSGYMINLAATNPAFAEKSRRALREELLRADQLGLPFLVLHPGAHLGAGVEAGLAKVVAGLDAVFAEIPRVKTRVALENTAGQGSTLGCEFEHLATILANVRQPERLCVCLDTAHLFASGYDLSTMAGAEKVFREFDRIVGRKHLAALHLNDSKTGLGSHLDRHEHIGQGCIGIEGFRYIMTAPRFAKIPKVLETPKGKDMHEDVENMARLRKLTRAPIRSEPRSRCGS